MQENLKNQSDLDLAKACCNCDTNAQRVLFEKVKNTMFGVCLRFSDNRQGAEDLLQEGFIRVYKDICKYNGKGSLEGWVRSIFVRTGIEYYHKSKKIPEIVDFTLLENVLNYENESLDHDDSQKLVDLIQKLPIGYRTVLNLYVLEDLSHEEIARELGIGVSTSRSQLTRAKELLKKIINNTLVLI